jgi:hypothetical protein
MPKLTVISLFLIFLSSASAQEPAVPQMDQMALLKRSWEPGLAHRILSRSTSVPTVAPRVIQSSSVVVAQTTSVPAVIPTPAGPEVFSPPEVFPGPEVVSGPVDRPVPKATSSPPPGLNPAIYGRLNTYNHLIERYSRMNGVDANLIRALIYVESSGDPTAQSAMGAQGLMQLMPATAEDMGVSNPLDPAQNIFGGARYIGELMERYDHVDLALWAYNAGPEAVDRRRLPAETKRFIPEVLRIKSALDARDS